ncbi:hypothetical protein BDR05DRAFT_273291 [Suillus weaverae]|nr:hypothetical protein BDR05DRAFT_273291 [Suillus weaverae]
MTWFFNLTTFELIGEPLERPDDVYCSLRDFLRGWQSAHCDWLWRQSSSHMDDSSDLSGEGVSTGEQILPSRRFSRWHVIQSKNEKQLS